MKYLLSCDVADRKIRGTVAAISKESAIKRMNRILLQYGMIDDATNCVANAVSGRVATYFRPFVAVCDALDKERVFAA